MQTSEATETLKKLEERYRHELMSEDERLRLLDRIKRLEKRGA